MQFLFLLLYTYILINYKLLLYLFYYIILYYLLWAWKRDMAYSALVYHARDPRFDPSRNQNIYIRVSSRKRPATSWEYLCPQKHLLKNPPFGIGIKTVDPICSR